MIGDGIKSICTKARILSLIMMQVGAGGSGNWQLGVLYGAEDVSEAKGLAGIVAVDLDIKGGIAITFAASPDFKIWSIGAGPGAGGDASAKAGIIRYAPIVKPLRDIFRNHQENE